MKDTLSEIFRTLRLTGGIFLDARFTAPWCVISHVTPDDVRPFITSPKNIVTLHYVVTGRTYVGIGDGERLEINEGELVLLPRSDEHIMSSGLDGEPINSHHLIEMSPDGGLARIVHGGDGEPTHIVCGFLATEDRFNPLIAALPRILKVNIREGVSRDWIESSVRFAAESMCKGEVASSPIMGRLSELLFAEAVRAYVNGLPEQERSWLKGLNDQYVGRALAALHDRLTEDWTVEALADVAGLSRSAFVERFSNCVGLPPMKYLTQSRLQLAKQLLRDGRQGVAQVAASVGYEAEEAFNRAFKREFGLPPAKWRDLQ
ncbi:cupin domain-containing protein [Aestuariivirga sp. YIM B02566]|uniref:AraC family transcriptional regulator n=1 Tax=Taklimakanibacter albus TaxID=2800327 RepID=A0ACC5RFZ8_9HYPH|nr:AraC family transcriptional regulator [Aestuariivirga sp. YIM B02566]